MIPHPLRLLLALVLCGTLAACEAEEEKQTDQQPPKSEQPEQAAEGLRLIAADYADLPGWQADPLDGALQALNRSCTRLLVKPADRAVGSPALPSTAADWQAACVAVQALGPNPESEKLRTVLQSEFQPFLATDMAKGGAEDGAGGEVEEAASGLFTGYFEAELKGSRSQSETYATPLYAKPSDLVTVDLGQFDPDLAGKGVVGLVDNGRLVPYPDRGDIEAGILAGKGLELLWIDDPVDVFLLQVQGSGRVILDNGEVVQVGFAAHNGRGYKSIGRKLIDDGELKPGEASWNGIRGWIRDHPDLAKDLFAFNPRFVFFRLLQGDGPIGAEGVALTPERSLAVDTRYIPLGMPLWLDTTRPGVNGAPMQRLMVAQDKGGAIKGVVRGDFFWGYGKDALKEAGRMKSKGRYYLLLPNPLAERVRATG